MVPGDLVAHGIPIDPADPSAGGNYTLLKETLGAVADIFIKYFPDTLVIPSMGNNDGKYHYQGIDEADKADYYGFFYQRWFINHPLYSKVASLKAAESTFKYAGYYRIDIDSKVSVLSINTMYLNKKNIPTHQGTEA